MHEQTIYISHIKIKYQFSAETLMKKNGKNYITSFRSKIEEKKVKYDVWYLLKSVLCLNDTVFLKYLKKYNS